MGTSYWVLRDWVHAGLLPKVVLPCAEQRRNDGVVTRRPGDATLRKILIDVRDLDELIERSKESENA